ncbi:MAG: Sec-independent protein translocase subunit TatA/TatB [Armatimonadota bacterium]
MKRLPEIGKSMAEGIHEFKKASRKLQEEINNDDDEGEDAKTDSTSKKSD